MAAHRRLRVRLLAGAGAALAAALVSVPALACTAIMGALSITPTSGRAGTVITTSASGLKIGPAQYALHFTTTSTNCMDFTGVVTLKTITTSRQGTWSNVTATIPSTASQGTHGLCGMEVSPVKGQTGTTHDSFTVV